MPPLESLPDGDLATARSLPNGHLAVHPDSSEETLTSALIHEAAHHLDRSVLGTENNWGTQQHEKFNPLYQVLKSSPTMQRLAKDGVIVMHGDEAGRRQLLQGREMLARAFEQLVAERSSDPSLKDKHSRLQRDELLGFQTWQPEEWVSIRPEVEKFFGVKQGATKSKTQPKKR